VDRVIIIFVFFVAKLLFLILAFVKKCL